MNKKILNLTRDESIDVIAEKREVFNPPHKYKLFTVSEETTYKLSKEKPHWKDTDSYKIIEV
jgi:hypothetical protein